MLPSSCPPDPPSRDSDDHDNSGNQEREDRSRLGPKEQQSTSAVVLGATEEGIEPCWPSNVENQDLELDLDRLGVSQLLMSGGLEEIRQQHTHLDYHMDGLRLPYHCLAAGDNLDLSPALLLFSR